tara:strand:+ start:644 stop:1249 length:606 start_codon:yes stop_codon:yes gene_type:complete
MASVSDVRALTISDENAASTTRIAAAAQPTSTFTLANTTHAGGAARNVTVTTAGTGDGSKSVTVVGTDVFGDSLTEVINSTGSAETVAGTKLFLTVASATCSAQYAANVSVGSGTLCAQAVEGANRVRIKGFAVVSGGTAGDVEFINGTPESGTTLFKSRTIGTANNTVDRTVPSQGVLFDSGASIKYTVDVADNITVFYA